VSQRFAGGDRRADSVFIASAQWFGPMACWVRNSPAGQGERFAYVALSRSRYDARVYTNDKAELTQALGREHGHRSALEHSVGVKSETLELAKSNKMSQSISHGFSH
jgi:hypothetical protein